MNISQSSCRLIVASAVIKSGVICNAPRIQIKNFHGSVIWGAGGCIYNSQRVVPKEAEVVNFFQNGRKIGYRHTVC